MIVALLYSLLALAPLSIDPLPLNSEIPPPPVQVIHSLPLSTLHAPPKIELDLTLEEELEAAACSPYFDCKVEYTPKKYRPGYVFRVTFFPLSEMTFQPLPNTLLFLVDRSNSVPKSRYNLNKKAVASALDYLKPGDRFNICLFDGQAKLLSKRPIAWNKRSVAEAKEFLERQGQGGRFTATEFYAALGSIDLKETQSAILFSNGKTFLSPEKQRQLIGEWTEENKQRVSLYVVASGKGNNLPVLDLITSFNKGRLCYVQDPQELSSQVVHLMQSISPSIGEQMDATAVCSEKQMNVLLQPHATPLPNLHANSSFVVYGSTNRLSDFTLFLQGKNHGQSFDIKKKISLSKAKLGLPSIEKRWTQLLVHDFYAHYLEDGNIGHLEAARQLLTPLDLPTAWLD